MTCVYIILRGLVLMQGPYETNEKLRNATKLFEGQIHGSGMPTACLKPDIKHRCCTARSCNDGGPFMSVPACDKDDKQ